MPEQSQNSHARRSASIFIWFFAEDMAKNWNQICRDGEGARPEAIPSIEFRRWISFFHGRGRISWGFVYITRRYLSRQRRHQRPRKDRANDKAKMRHDTRGRCYNRDVWVGASCGETKGFPSKKQENSMEFFPAHLGKFHWHFLVLWAALMWILLLLMLI